MSGSPATDTLSKLPLAEVIDRVAAPTPAPGGGTSAAIVCSAAAALVEMGAGFEDDSDRRARAAALRGQALDLAERDLHSYLPVLEALRRPADDAERPARLAAALAEAASVPFGIVTTAAEVAAQARGATEAAGRHLLGDCATAAVLAEAACRAAALLVEINLRGTADPRLAEAEELVRAASVDSQHAQERAREN